MGTKATRAVKNSVKHLQQLVRGLRLQAGRIQTAPAAAARCRAISSDAAATDRQSYLAARSPDQLASRSVPVLRSRHRRSWSWRAESSRGSAHAASPTIPRTHARVRSLRSRAKDRQQNAHRIVVSALGRRLLLINHWARW